MRPRFTVRAILALVAIVALLIGGELMRRRRQRCLESAAQCEEAAASCRGSLANFTRIESLLKLGSRHARPGGGEMSRAASRNLEKTSDYVETIRRNAGAFEAWGEVYRRGASHPWEAIPEMTLPSKDRPLPFPAGYKGGVPGRAE